MNMIEDKGMTGMCCIGNIEDILGFPKFFLADRLICLISLICLYTDIWTIFVQPLELYKTMSVQPFELFISHIWHVQDLDTFK